MIIVKIHKHLYKMESDPGCVFAAKDGSMIFGKILYVPTKERAQAFIEIPDND